MTRADKIDTISAELRQWEIRAKASLHLDGFLHPTIRAQLVERMLATFERMSAAESAAANAATKATSKERKAPANA